MSQEPIDAEIVEAAPLPPATPGPAPSPAAAPDYDSHGVPSLDHVRAKIESRYATSLGGRELADETPQGRLLVEQEEDRARAATARLEEIRRSLRDGS